MRNISAKADGIGDTLPASDFNSNLRSELQNVVTSSGQTLDPEGGPDTDVEMLGKAMTIYSNAAQYYQDSGAANAYVLARTGNLKPLAAYIDGTEVTFKIGNTNTGASTINIDSLGSKSLEESDGTALSAGRLVSGTFATAIFNASDDRFEIKTPSHPVEHIFTTSGTWTKPAGLKSIDVWVIGGGGGGGGIVSDANSHAGTSGAGGGAAFKNILASALSSSETVTIGAGGGGGSTSGTDGIDGGTSSFGSHCSATGGEGGIGDPIGVSSYPVLIVIGTIAIGGVGLSGDINLNGQSGMFGDALAANRTRAGRGGAAAGIFGGQMTDDDYTATSSAGKDGYVYGGGGGGSISDAAGGANTGGTGADGVIFIREYF